MVDNDRSKLQLERDVRLLFNLLERAKKERRSYEVTIRQLDRSVDASNARVVEVRAVSSLAMAAPSCLFLFRSSLGDPACETQVECRSLCPWAILI